MNDERKKLIKMAFSELRKPSDEDMRTMLEQNKMRRLLSQVKTYSRSVVDNGQIVGYLVETETCEAGYVILAENEQDTYDLVHFPFKKPDYFLDTELWIYGAIVEREGVNYLSLLDAEYPQKETEEIGRILNGGK